MLEHFIVLLVGLYVVRTIRKYHINSRGKIGLISNLIKFFLRLARKLSFFNNKIEKQLETDAAKNTE